jgi:hypothetical protein
MKHKLFFYSSMALLISIILIIPDQITLAQTKGLSSQNIVPTLISDATTSAFPNGSPGCYIFTGLNLPQSTPRSIQIYWPISTSITNTTPGNSTFSFWAKNLFAGTFPVTQILVNGNDAGLVTAGDNYDWVSIDFPTGWLDQGMNNVIEIWTSTTARLAVACDAPKSDDTGEVNAIFIRNNGGTASDNGPKYGEIFAKLITRIIAPTISEVIPPSGGTLTSPDDGTLYNFPAGAFLNSVDITYTPMFTSEVPPTGDLLVAGHTFSITGTDSGSGDPVQPDQPYTLTITYTEGEQGSAMENTLALYYWDGSQWLKETSSVIDTINNTITATPGHFSLWAVLGETQRVFLPLISR